LTVGLREGDQTGIRRLGHPAEQKDRLAVQEGTAADRDVEGVGPDLLPPGDFSLEVERRHDRRAEDDEDVLAVGDGRGSGVAAAGAAAEIIALPGTRRDDRIPQEL